MILVLSFLLDLEEIERGGEGKTPYTVSSQTGEEEVKLILTEKETEGGTEIHPSITNREFSPEKVSENYGWRWRVETNIREFEKLPWLREQFEIEREIVEQLVMAEREYLKVLRNRTGRTSGLARK